MANHLLLPAPLVVPSRRSGGGGSGGTPRNRPQHSADLREQLASAVSAPSRLDKGIDPALVFKLRATGRPDEHSLELRNLAVLGETRDYTYFVLTENPHVLDTALQGYAEDGTLRTLFDAINGIEPYGPEDRRGPGLDDPDAQFPLRVDVSVWPADDQQGADARVALVDGVLSRGGVQVEYRSVSARRTLVRAVVDESTLDTLLRLSVVERVRTPPVPFLDSRDWRPLTASELQRRVKPGAVVGVLDDAPATGHPLLAGLVESIDEMAPAGYLWQQPGHHGTEVVGRALLPDLHHELRQALPVTVHGTVRVARILEQRPGHSSPDFVASGFPHQVVERAVRLLHERYGVRVFSLAVGYADAWDEVHVEALTETIDELVRELGVVVVVPAGNATPLLDGTTPSGHHVRRDYRGYLSSREQRLSEPGPAALALTVGSVALSGAPDDRRTLQGWLAVAPENDISPFSRVGPGAGAGSVRHNKPDLVDHGGNVVVNDQDRVVPNEAGAGVVSTALDPISGRLFATCNGTSFAVPAVARVAAEVVHAYPDASANLVRVLVAASARRPSTAAAHHDANDRASRFGWGRPNSLRAVESGRRRATMTFDGSMLVDQVRLHPIPLPEVFRRGSGARRRLIIALAFDPPVRRRRREYLAGRMQVNLYRDVDPADLAAMLAKQDADALPTINDRRRPGLTPGTDVLLDSTLQVRTWEPTNSFVTDDETFYVAITHRCATWARSDPDYEEQPYALAVVLEDEALLQADLRQLLLQQVRQPARLRVRP